MKTEQMSPTEVAKSTQRKVEAAATERNVQQDTEAKKKKAERETKQREFEEESAQAILEELRGDAEGETKEASAIFTGLKEAAPTKELIDAHRDRLQQFAELALRHQAVTHEKVDHDAHKAAGKKYALLMRRVEAEGKLMGRTVDLEYDSRFKREPEPELSFLEKAALMLRNPVKYIDRQREEDFQKLLDQYFEAKNRNDKLYGSWVEQAKLERELDAVGKGLFDNYLEAANTWGLYNWQREITKTS